MNVIHSGGFTARGGAGLHFRAISFTFGLVLSVGALAEPGESRFVPATGEAGSAPESLVMAGDSLYFAADDGIHGKELWRIDAEGEAHFVGDFLPGPEGSQPRSLVAVGDRLAFVGTRYSYQFNEPLDYVWSTGGTAADTDCVLLPVSESKPGDTTLVSVEGKLFGAGTHPKVGRELFCFSGGGATDILPGLPGAIPKEQEYFASIGSKLFFTVQAHSISSRHLWALDTNPVANASPPEPVMGEDLSADFSIHCKAANGRVWFAGSADENGMELCVTDGTRAGTLLVKDINPGFADSVPKDFAGHEGIVYFQATDGVHGVELWRTDGTEAGTWMVIDINPGRWDSNPYNMCSIGSYLLFAATREDEGTELWRTDGTEEGTQLVSDVFPGPRGSNLYQPTAYNGTLLFAAEHPEFGDELWRSDGTAEGTRLVRDIHPGAGKSEPYYLTPFNDRIYFCANDGVHGEEVWCTDGTREGTVLAADIRPQTRIVRSSNPTGLVATDKHVYFAADDLVHGDELWWSDIDTLETRMALDIRPGAEASAPKSLTIFQDEVFFTADDGQHGRELWRCRAGGEPQLVADLVEGELSSNPRLLTLAGSELFFVATAKSGADALYQMGVPDAVPERVVEAEAFGAPLDIENLREWAGQVYVCGRGSNNYFRFGVLKFPGNGFHMLPFELPEAASWETVTAVSSGATMGDGDAGGDLLQCYLSLSGMRERSAWFNGRWFFAARSAANGAELWTSRGDVDSAEMLYDCNPGVSSGSPRAFCALGGDLLFAAERATRGRELWTTDGTAEGTHIVTDWHGRTFKGAGPEQLTLFGEAVFYSAPGFVWYGERRALTKCIQSPNGLLVVTAAEGDRHWPDNPGELTPAGGWLYFAADHPATGRELWRYGEVEYIGDDGMTNKYTTYRRVQNLGLEPAYIADTEITARTWLVGH